jgi:hypothetical protein
MSTASIIAAINSKLVSTAASNTNRFTVKKLMEQLSDQTKQRAQSFQMSAFEAVSDVDVDSASVVGSVSYIFSNALFALSAALINDGVIDDKKEVSEFRFLSVEELECEIVASAQKVLGDLSVSQGDSFDMVLEELRYHRSLTLSTMHEIFQLLEGSGSGRDTVLTYMDVIRDTFNYAMACMDSCLEASEFKFQESQDTTSKVVSVNIRVPTNKDVEAFISLKREIVQGEIGEYVRRSYGTMNQMIDLTSSYVVARIHTEAFTHFVTVHNDFDVIINGRTYNMSHRDVMETCRSFHALVRLTKNKVYEYSLRKNRDSLLNASHRALPAYINRKIEKSRSLESNKVRKTSEQKDLIDQFNDHFMGTISSHNKLKHIENSLEGFTDLDEVNVYDVVDSSNFYAELEEEGKTSQSLLGTYETKVNGKHDATLGFESAKEHVTFRLEAGGLDAGYLSSGVFLVGAEYQNFPVDATKSLVENGQLVVDKNKYKHLPALKDVSTEFKNYSDKLSATKDAFESVKARMIFDASMGQTVNPGLVDAIEEIIKAITNDVRGGDFYTQHLEADDATHSHPKITHIKLTNQIFEIDENFSFYIKDKEKEMTEYFKYGDKYINYPVPNKLVYYKLYKKGHSGNHLPEDLLYSIKHLKQLVATTNDKVNHLSALITELQLAVDLSSDALVHAKQTKAEYMLQVNSDLQDAISVTSEINNLKYEKGELDKCIKRARTKINEIVNIRDQLQFVASGNLGSLSSVEYQR